MRLFAAPWANISNKSEFVVSPNVVTVRLIEGSKALCIYRKVNNDDTPMAISIMRRLYLLFSPAPSPLTLFSHEAAPVR